MPWPTADHPVPVSPGCEYLKLVCGGLSTLLLATLGWTLRRATPCAGRSTAQRVVCASPAVAEIVFALGAGERVVGVSDFSDWPPEAKAKPRIGGALVPNREVILALQPDLILAQGQAETLRRFATAQGIHFAAWPLDTLADLRAMIHGIAQRWAKTKMVASLWRGWMPILPRCAGADDAGVYRIEPRPR